jgi:hypothetical protein
MDEDAYTAKLIDKLTDTTRWGVQVMTNDSMFLIQQINNDLKNSTVSSRIAIMLVQHQVMHEMTKDMIELSNLYIQGEIWPTVYRPVYDRGEERMTGWYLAYFKNNCIESKGKDAYINKARRLNEIRNKVAHNILGKNAAIINQSFEEFQSLFTEVNAQYVECANNIIWRLSDLTKRVDFTDFKTS